MFIRPFTAVLLLAAAMTVLPLYRSSPSDSGTGAQDAGTHLSVDIVASAESETPSAARDITGKARVRGPKPFDSRLVTDGLYHTSISLPAGTELTVSAREPVGAIYLETEAPAGKLSLCVGETAMESEEAEFLHFTVENIHSAEFTLCFGDGVQLNNIHLLSLIHI